MTNDDIEQVYREYLEEDIVKCISKRRNISLEEGLKLYYNSHLADQIHEGLYGIQYLDYKILTEYLEKEIEQNAI